MSENQPKQSRLGPAAGVGRRVQVAGFVIIALVAALGYGYAKPAASAPVAHTSRAGGTSSPVNSAELVCPVVKDFGDTNVSTFTPTTVAGAGTGTGTATVSQLSQLGGTGTPKTILTVGRPGALAGTAQAINGGAATDPDLSDPVVARVTGPDAPGFTVTETLGANDADKGTASMNCISPDTDFWFTGFGTDKDPFALLNIVNAESVPASVNVTVYSGDGPLSGNAASSLQGLTITAASQLQELVSNLAAGQPAPYAVHVVATVGRVTAGLLDFDGNGNGRDFIGAQKAAGTLVLPGIPQSEDNEKIQLSLLSPDAPASVALRWVGQSTIVPATASFTGQLDQGKVAAVDLSSVANTGEYATLEVCGSDSSPSQCLPVTGTSGPVKIVGSVEVTQSDHSGQDTAFISPVSALAGDGVVADNPAGSVLTLTNTGTTTATVKVTQTPNGKGTSPVVNTYTVKPGATLGQALAMPKGATDYALTVTPSGGTVYAARIVGTGHQLTIQPLSTAAETVRIPAVVQDVSGLVPQN